MAHVTSWPKFMLFLFLFAFLFIAIASSPAAAQGSYYSGYDEPHYTLTPFVGVRYGGRIDINTPNVDYLQIHNSFNGGFNFGARVAPHLFAEFMWNRQTTTLSAHHIGTNSNVTLTNKAHVDLYQGSLLYEIPSDTPVVPFVVGGIGFTHFDSHGILSFDNRFSYNLGGGVKYLLARQVAIRGELRYSPSRTTSASTVFCDPFLGCFTTPVSNHAQQWQTNIGVELRF